MKKHIILGIFSFIILVLAGCGTQTAKTTVPVGNPTEIKKVTPGTESGTCAADTNCETGLKCITGKCSSGKVNSVCATYKDCSAGLYCIKSVCANPPSYSKYFNKLTVGKIRIGMPPGPTNISVPTTEFNAATDALKIDFISKTGTEGELYYELIDSTTGETALSSSNNKTKVNQGGGGIEFGLPMGTLRDFELNIYFNDEPIYAAVIKIK